MPLLLTRRLLLLLLTVVVMVGMHWVLTIHELALAKLLTLLTLMLILMLTLMLILMLILMVLMLMVALLLVPVCMSVGGTRKLLTLCELRLGKLRNGDFKHTTLPFSSDTLSIHTRRQLKRAAVAAMQSILNTKSASVLQLNTELIVWRFNQNDECIRRLLHLVTKSSLGWPVPPTTMELSVSISIAAV